MRNPHEPHDPFDPFDPLDPNYPKFRNKNGDLNAYAFGCGYVQSKVFPDGSEVRLFRDGNWHVQTWLESIRKRTLWNTYDTLGEARKEFRRQCKQAPISIILESFLNA